MMDARPPDLLPKDVLFGLLPAVFKPWGNLYPSRPPTDRSVRRIGAELGVRLPALFLEVAAATPSYGAWFGSIGDDFASHNHILSINRSFRELEGLPPRYVLLNHGHDGDCDAWDTEAQPSSGGELPIVYFNHDYERGELRALRVTATSFAQYIDTFVRAHAPRCGTRGVRRRAKRILAEHGGPPLPNRPSQRPAGGESRA